MAQLIPVGISIGLNLLASLFAPPAPIPDYRVPKSDYGTPLPRIYGRVRIEGNKFWPDTKERMYRRQGGKGKGGGGKGRQPEVYGTFATVFCQGPASIEAIILNGETYDNTHGRFQFYVTWFDGTQTSPWSEMTARDEAPFNEIAYTGLAYAGLTNLPLNNDFGGQIPQQVGAVLVDDKFGDNPTMAEIVGDMCARAGVTNIDTTDIADIVMNGGFIVNEAGDGYRQAFETLFQLYLFTAYETKTGIIKFVKLSTITSSSSLTVNQLLPVGDNNITVETVESKIELPSQLSVKFKNIEKNYDDDEWIEYFEESTKENAKTVDGSGNVFLKIDDVKSRVRQLLRYFYIQQRTEYKIKIPAPFLQNIELRSNITLPSGLTIQVEQIALGADYTAEITGRLYVGVGSYDSASTPPVINPAPDPTQDIPELFILDIPRFKDTQLPGTLFGFARKPCTIIISIDGGNSYQTQVNHTGISTYGDVLTVLANGSGTDTVNTVDLEVESGAVNSITDAQLSANLNLMLIGKQVNGYFEGELIQFRDVQVLTANTVRISYLKRGLFNTGKFSNTHATSTKWFLLTAETDAYYSEIQGQSEYVGQTLTFVPVVASYQNIATTPAVTVTPQGNSYTPPTVTNVTGTIDPSGNITYSWQYNPAFSPFNDSTQNATFEVDIMNGATVVRTLDTETKSVRYLIADRTADGLGINLTIRVFAVSQVVGRGDATEVTINPTVVNADELTVKVNATTFPSRNLIEFLDGSGVSLVGADNTDRVTITPSVNTLPVSITTNYTLLLRDNRKWIKASGTITVSMLSSPPDYYEAIIQNIGTGVITISGITNLVGTKLTKQWTACHVYYDGNEWTAVGALTT